MLEYRAINGGEVCSGTEAWYLDRWRIAIHRPLIGYGERGQFQERPGSGHPRVRPSLEEGSQRLPHSETGDRDWSIHLRLLREHFN